MPSVSLHNFLMSTINGTEAGIQFMYMLISLVFALKKEVKIFGLFNLVLTRSQFPLIIPFLLSYLLELLMKLFCN